MAKATDSVHLTQLRTRLHIATITLARRAALQATKRTLAAQGIKPQTIPLRDLQVAAKVYLTEHREALVVEAKEVVERWAREGFFGKRCAQGGKR